MIHMQFDTLWRFISHRRPSVVQERSELEHIYNLIAGCESYLEIGTAEGDSLYVLSHALKPGAKITSIDLGEQHTRPYIDQMVRLLSPDYSVALYRGDSTDYDTYPKKERHDVVLIDGGHDYKTVLADAIIYGNLAKKYLLFHDIMLPDVRKAMDKFLSDGNIASFKYQEFVNSPTMGFGIVEIR